MAAKKAKKSIVPANGEARVLTAPKPQAKGPPPQPPAPTPAAALPQTAPPPQPMLPQQILQALAVGQPPAPQQRVYVSFSAEINANTTEALIALVTQQANAGVKEIYLMLSTPGGTVMNGLNLYNILRALPVTIITHNVGNVDSIGNAIFLAGVERYACPHSTFMFHGVGFDITTAARFEEKTLRERLGSVLADQKRIGSIIEERTNIKAAQIRSLFKEARTKDADYARSVGIIHDIREVQIAPGAPVFSLVFKR